MSRVSLGERQRILASFAGALASGLTPAAFAQMGPGPLFARMRAGFARGSTVASVLREIGVVDAVGEAFVVAGETTGRLPEVLRILASRVAEKRRDRGRLFLALLYPAFLLLAAIVVLPLPLAFRSGLKAYLLVVLPALLVCGGAAVLALVVLPALPPESAPRRGLMRIGLALPVVGSAIRNGAIATFLEVLGACARSGLEVRSSLRLAADAAAVLPAFASPGALRRLDSGGTLAESLSAYGVIPVATLASVGQGELSGTLDRVLPFVAEELRSRSKVQIVIAVVAVGALSLLAVGGTIVWSIFEGWNAYLRSIPG